MVLRWSAAEKKVPLGACVGFAFSVERARRTEMFGSAVGVGRVEQPFRLGVGSDPGVRCSLGSVPNGLESRRGFKSTRPQIGLRRTQGPIDRGSGQE